MRFVDRLQRPQVYLAAGMAFVLVLGVVVVQARAALPKPRMLSQYDVRLCSADDMADCDPQLDTPPAGATVTDVTGLNVGQIHHLDVDGDGDSGGGGGCAAWHQAGEVAGRCDDNPDVTVQVTIESSIGQSAPIMRINRAPSAILENRPAPPTRVDITYTITDTAGLLPDMQLGFGYATPPGGTIPLKISGYVLGMLPPPDADSSWVPFNPMTIVVDSGQFTTLSGAAPVAPTYAGPLTITGAFSMPASGSDDAIKVDAELTYMPLPERIAVEWERDDPSSHRILYGHDAPGTHEHFDDPACNPLDDPPVSGCPRDVDLRARVRATSGDDPDPAANEFFQVDARIDRVPNFLEVDLDILTEEGRRNQGVADLTVPTSALLPSGHLPDARFDILSRVPNEGPDADTFPVDVQVVTAHVEQMPTQLHVEWYIPEKDEIDGAPGCEAVTDDLPADVTDPCLARASFTVPGGALDGPFMGGVELAVRNFEGESPVLDRFLPGWNQYLNLQSAPVASGSARLHQLLTARVERIRTVVFAETAEGFDAHAELGDGAQPLQVHIGTDERTVEREDEPGVFGMQVDADILVSPLPDDLSITVQLPDDDAELPLVVNWDASGSLAPSIDLHGRIELRGAPAQDGAACGQPHTMCADFQIDHVPDVGMLEIDAQDDETFFALDTTPSAEESLDVILGLVARTCGVSAPIVAEVDLRRVPQHVRARAVTPVVSGNPEVAPNVCALDRPDTPPEDDAPKRDLVRFELHPCVYDFDARTCQSGTEGAFGAMTVAARNFVERPDELPHVPIVTTPLYVSAAVRDAGANVDPDPTEDNLFEVEARLLEVRELQVVQEDGTIGARVRAGKDTTGDGAGDDPFMVAFDFENILFETGDPEDPDAPEPNRQDLRGHALIDPLPTHVDLCFRPPGGDLVEGPHDPLTVICQDTDPFGPDAPVTVAPTSLAIDSSAEFELDAYLEQVDRGTDDAAGATHDDRTIRTSMHVVPVPSDGVGNQPDLVIHVQTPDEDVDTNDDATAPTDSAVRMQFDAVDPSVPIVVDFAAEILDGEMFCTDPRPAPEIEPDPVTGDRRFQEALCMRGRIENLPTSATLIYDPETEGENFRFEHNGSAVNIVDLLLSAVTAEVDPGFDETLGTDDDEVLPAILIVEGELLGLPPLIKGTIVPPGTVALRSVDPATENPSNPAAEQDGAPVEQINVVVRNFIAPDPMPGMPAQRVLDAGPLPEPDHVFQVFQRNELFKAIVEVGALVKAGFETQRDVDGNFLDTSILTIDFGEPDDVVRGYADLQAPTERDDPDTEDIDEARESLVATIADVTLQDKPAGVSVCFRGKREHAAPPVNPVFCDTAPDLDGGAVQVRMRPFDEAATTRRLDVDAFLRMSSAGGGDVLSATAHIDNMPFVVQGVFSDDGADFEGLDLAGQPQGIDAISLELANFDLHEEAAGYGTSPPWSQRVDGPGWTAPGGAHADGEISFSRERISDYFARLRVLNDVLFVQFAFGVIDAPGTSDSNLQRVSFANSPCPAPTDPAPTDYPHFPTDLNSEYTCIRGFFEEHEGGSQQPMFLELVVDDGPERLSLNAEQPHDENRFASAGLSRLPRAFQATMASAVTLDENSALRDPCGPHGQHAAGDVACMPPMLRLDIEPNGPVPAFFGMLEMGRRNDLRTVRTEARPRESIAGGDFATTTTQGRGLAEPPGPDGFEAWPDGHGLRGRIVSVGDDDVVILGVHVPLAGSLTFDQLQKWDCENGAPDCPGTTAEAPPAGESAAGASDLRLRYVARDAFGQILDTIGQLALMVIDDDQILLADPDDPFVAGVTLPGEFGLQMYKRDLWEPEDDDAKYGRKFLQLDGRASEEIRLGARIFGEEVKRVHARVVGTGVIPEGDVDPLNPSFRLRTRIDKNTPVEDEDDCIIWVVFNFCKLANVNDISLLIDYREAKRVDAYVVVDKPENAVEIRGYDVFHGTANADQAPIDLDISADLDITILLAIPIILHIIAALDISADMTIDTAEQFRWKNQLLRMTAAHRGDAGGVSVNPKIVPTALAGLLLIPIPFFTIVWGFAYVWPPNLGPMLVEYQPCHTFGGSLGGFSVSAGDTVSRYADPTIDPRLIEFGNASIGSWLMRFIAVSNPTGIGPGVGLLGIAAWFVSCVYPGQTDLPLISDGAEVGPPTAIDAHPVPGFGTATVVAPPAPQPAVPEDLDIDDAVALCGAHVHRRVRVLDGGTVTVATGGDCPESGDSGTLLLVANEIEVANGGTVDLRAATGQVELNAENLVVSSGGAVRGGVQPVLFTVVDLLQIDGEVTSDAIRTGMSFGGSAAATGNSGAGHGGAGGDGSHGSGGVAYGDTTLDPDEDTGLMAMEPGSRGAGTSGTRGRGGGQLQLSASKIRIAGLVSADGGDATRSSADASRQCSVPDDPDTEEDESEENTGLPGPGGGSGGTVVLRAQVVNVTGGTVSVTGGAGADGKGGGGGGGAGGHLKLAAPVYEGSAPDRAGGAGGSSLCPDDFDHGQDGNDGPVIEDRSPSSRVAPVEGFFFHRGEDLELPMRAAARHVGSSNGFQVVLCGLRRPPEAVLADDEDSAEANFGIDVPAPGSQSISSPCGTATDDTTVHDLGYVDFPNTTITDDNTTIPATHTGGSVNITQPSGNGFWGLYTVIAKPATQGNDCFDRTDFTVLGSGLLYDSFDCTLEAIPTQPDTILGIDNTPPEVGTVNIGSDGDGNVTSPGVQVSVGNVTDSMPFSSGDDAIEGQSGVRTVQCRNEGESDDPEAAWRRCGIGTFDWDLTPGADGERTLEVRAIDFAGNVSDTATATVTLDSTPPTFTATIIGDPDGNNGWYRTAPAFQLDGFEDHGGSGPGDPVPYEYWFNGGSHRNCLLEDVGETDPVCVIDSGVPLLGIHRFFAVAIDDVGHRSDPEEKPFKTDNEAPHVAVLTAPFEPDAANDWFGRRPWVVVNGLDQPLGSGLTPFNDDDLDTGIFYTIDGGELVRSDALFELGPGAHEVCYYAVDQAGNPSAGEFGAPAAACDDVLVDDENPTVTFSVAPADGNNGWYVTPPNVVVNASDPSSGVGNSGSQCAPLATPTGVCLSRDLMTWEDDAAGSSRTFDTDGVHSLRAFATDVAGKRSALSVLELNVDLTAPVTMLRTQPPAPIWNDRFRVSPEVHLSAHELHMHNSGVARIEWCLEDTRTGATECATDGDFTVYDGPFLVPDGHWELQYRAVDLAGNVENLRSEPLIVDTSPPSVEATAAHPNPINVGQGTTLHWTAFDDLSDEAEVAVYVYGWLPAVGFETLRRIELGTIDPSPQHDGSNPWDGRRELMVVGSLTLAPVPGRPLGGSSGNCLPLIDPLCDAVSNGPLPLVGRYWYQVVVTDEAGNAGHSSESVYIQVNLG